MSHLFLRLTALPFGLSPYLREEGRLAVSVGVTARRDSGHHVTWPSDPKPSGLRTLWERYSPVGAPCPYVESAEVEDRKKPPALFTLGITPPGLEPGLS